MDDFGKRLDSSTIEFVRILPGPIEKVWAYLWDAEKRGEWFAAGAMPTKVGDTFEMRFKHADYSPHKAPPPEKMAEVDRNGHIAHNTLLAYEPPTRLAFTFGPDTHPGETSEVEFRLAPEGDKVRLTLTHSKIPDRAFAVAVSGGWHSHLTILRYKAEGKVPPAFWDIWRKFDGVYEKLYE